MADVETALHYLTELGWAVLPTEPGEKRPHPELGSWTRYQDRLPTEDEVRAWAERWPECEWGAVTGAVSDLVVVDIDAGEKFPPVEDRLEHLLERAPTDLIARTPSGGLHLFYHHPGELVSTVADTEETGIDIRGDGGFIKLPSSLEAAA